MDVFDTIGELVICEILLMKKLVRKCVGEVGRVRSALISSFYLLLNGPVYQKPAIEGKLIIPFTPRT